MSANGNPQADEYLKEITAQAKVEGKIDEMNQVLSYLIGEADSHLDNIEKSLQEYTLRERMGDMADVINLAYIARHYFGKTRQWLYQRLKGQIVNGKPAAFTSSEEETFEKALNEIGLQLIAFRVRS